MFGLLLLKECNACGSVESRVVTDSWTGLELCFECAIQVLPRTTMSPEEEGDNLKAELREHLDGPLAVEDDES